MPDTYSRERLLNAIMATIADLAENFGYEATMVDGDVHFHN